mmetsp:Transcript_300/g.546  ORF Transcript_300/g.546 Transcript_300/m.546 type:complete len:127 (-) Transcript_300:79-459(-)|eukprot:CAMPEP_0117420178 /NCGR_PEP_ID=MMETSP0758-20121206/1566_1 /TAXON_ID=63605 /ORGANISM="Percolomonas cosmopolitus, Strain AE-1 (ATCC 50343)" /LENGTH=126 /DNA_ID=CAMNT_0005201635 /DNA_START=28 /DNA_END=408 /DNA_ORIENTATION=+
MSWDGYVDAYFIKNGFDGGAIFGLNGGQWAAKNLTISSTEIQSIIAGLSNPNDIRAKGIHAQGVKYFAVQADEEHLLGKKDKTGIIVVKTGKAVGIGIFDEEKGLSPGNANKFAYDMKDYLCDAGY